jgi:ABC-type branched-subunit amino acid transport system ATPase component/ABC-type branched-subunit amino acid transport system permease subunit
VGAALVLGTITGLTTGMLAVGLVLVYKAGRFANLAHGQLGALSAVLLATFVLDLGWSWWFAFPVVVLIGISTALLVERFVIRPLRTQGRRGATMLIVTIGVGQLLLALTYIPALGPDPATMFREQYPLPFTVHWRVAGADLTGAHVMILLLVPLLVGAVTLFLRSTTLGKTIRAAASNADAARLCGISVDRVNAVTWGIAGGLSAVTAILLAPGQSVFNAEALGPSLLLRALGAAAMGGFVSIPGAMVGGLALGLVEHFTLAVTHRGSSAEVAVFLAVLLVLFVRGRQISAAADASEDLVEERTRIRIPAAVADRFVVRHHRALLGCFGLAFALVIPNVPYFNRNEHQFLLVVVVVLATVGIGLTMLLGWAGQVSLGHFALVGIGAFIAARFGDTVSLPALLVLAGLVGALTMAVVGIPALRLRGLTLAVTTLGLAVVAPAWLFVQSWLTGGGQNVVSIPPLGVAGVGRSGSELGVYYMGVLVLALAAITAGALRRSIPGRMIVAARDNERALATFGVTPATVKLATLAVSGFFAAAAGVIWGAAWRSVSYQLVAPAQSLALLAIPVVGGLGSIAGAVVGAVLVYGMAYFVGPELRGLLGDFGTNLGFQLALSGVALVAVPLLYPGGVAGAAQGAWGRFLAHLGRGVDRWAPTEAPKPLEVRDVTISFGGIRALDEVSIQVGAGEIVGLIGSNGAGKSTLLNVISGQLRSDGGSVLVCGHDVTDLAPEIRQGYGLGRSYQDARLFPGLTVAESVQLAQGQRGGSVGFVSAMMRAPWATRAEVETREQAEVVLASLGLGEWSEALTSELSTGLRRITDLAMQVAGRPQVLLLDEPTAGVAQREAEAFGPMLRRIRDELDCSILIVEHDMPLLMGLCDRIYALERGGVIAEGSPEEIRNDPMVIASYLGTDVTAVERSGPAATKRARSRPRATTTKTKA